MKATLLTAVLGATTATHALSIPHFNDAINRFVDQSPLVSSNEQYLIELAPGETRLVTEDEKWALRRQGINFFDITNSQRSASTTSQKKRDPVTYPSHPHYNSTVQDLIPELSKKNMHTHLETFTSFHTRYYKSDTGAESSAWLLSQVNQTLAEAGAGTVQAFPHPWGQNSIIATLPGKSENTVVIGAHQDSINLFLPSIFAAPGADDDGSGTVTILEALRVLLQDPSILHGKAENTVEFHWYSAEEGGLLGSNAIFEAYEQEGRDVKAMLQQDMTGYTHGTLAAGEQESVGVIQDYVDPGLTSFIEKIVSTYCTIPFVRTKCGYACSDHASASKAGYPSAFVIESDFKYSDKKIHTTDDKLEYLDFDHMLQHARLTLGLVYELAFAKFE